MTMRLWIGLWSSVFCVLIVAFDMSSFVRYFTRFTEESFAALVGIIFIFESLKKLYGEEDMNFCAKSTDFDFIGMSYKYKVHEGYHVSHAAFLEENCHCVHPNDSKNFLDFTLFFLIIL